MTTSFHERAKLALLGTAAAASFTLAAAIAVPL
jgi:hypothetical protein